MPEAIKAKDNVRHATHLADKAQRKEVRELMAIRDGKIKAMKVAWKVGRPGANANGPIAGTEADQLLRILAAQLGLIDPD